MRRRFRHITAILLFGYILAGTLLEVAHNHRHDIPLFSQHTLAAHDCGAHERHVPLGKIHDCLACTHSTQRVAVETAPYIVTDPTVISFAVVPSFNEQPGEADILHSGKRGPPLRLL